MFFVAVYWDVLRSTRTINLTKEQFSVAEQAARAFLKSRDALTTLIVNYYGDPKAHQLANYILDSSPKMQNTDIFVEVGKSTEGGIIHSYEISHDLTAPEFVLAVVSSLQSFEAALEAERISEVIYIDDVNSLNSGNLYEYIQNQALTVELRTPDKLSNPTALPLHEITKSNGSSSAGLPSPSVDTKLFRADLSQYVGSESTSRLSFRTPVMPGKPTWTYYLWVADRPMHLRTFRIDLRQLLSSGEGFATIRSTIPGFGLPHYNSAQERLFRFHVDAWIAPGHGFLTRWSQ
jgi:hypothetical protein